LNWTVVTGGTLDPTTGSMVNGTTAARSLVVNGFAHFVGINTSNVRVFENVEQGDCILDLPAATPLDGLTGLTFTINGRVYIQKNIGEKLAQAWDANVQGAPLTRTLLLRLQT